MYKYAALFFVCMCVISEYKNIELITTLHGDCEADVTGGVKNSFSQNYAAAAGTRVMEQSLASLSCGKRYSLSHFSKLE